MKKLKINEKKKYIQLAIMIVILSTTSFLIYSQFIKPDETDISTPILVALDSGIQVADLIGLQPEVSPQEILRGLVKFGDWPVILGVLGRSNPFLPL